MSQAKVFKLKCAVQKYEWGKIGSSSAVASLSKSGNPDFNLEEDAKYAELWMGTHPKGPSVIQPSGTPLTSWIQDNPDSVGEKVSEMFPATQQGQLPFLFKVLSVNKALSIQAHPNKALAERLHAEQPDKYLDPNHKPEMAIALTPFQGLCGFRPKDEIVSFLNSIPEFKAICGEDAASALSASSNQEQEQTALRKCFTSLMKCDPADVKQAVDKVAARIKELNSADKDALFLRVNEQFPGDCGCFCIYLLNYIILQPGESMFLGANVPHAYLAGDCMECMACSDNVVRAGFTPKFKDVATLCSMLNYTCKPAADNLFKPQPHPSDPYVMVYDPPVPDFSVLRIQVPDGVESYDVEALDSASIILVIEGSASTQSDSLDNLSRGSVIFVSAKQPIKLTINGGGLLMFRAYCHL